MNRRTHRAIAGILLAVAGTGLTGGAARVQVLAAQSSPAASAPSTVPAASATAAAAAASKKPTFDELLAGKTAPFDYEDTPVNVVIDALGKSYGMEIENNYQNDTSGKPSPVIVDLTAATAKEARPVPRVTAKLPGSISAHEAIGVINATIMPLGFAAVESVRLRDDAGHAPYAVLTIMATRKDAGESRPVYYGMDADKIPEGDQLRTQVITLKYLDIAKAHDIVASVLAKSADITISPDRKTLIITDTDTHVHSAATVLQILENQAAPPK